MVYLTMISDFLVLNERKINENELKRIWKEAVVTLFKVLPWHLSGGSKESLNLSQVRWLPGQDLNHGAPEYKAQVLTTKP
jgi:hypothetical protein